MKPLCVSRYAVGYRRTLDHLRAWQLNLPATKEISITLSPRGNGHSGTRLFIFENVPQLKFHNPHLKVVVNRERTTLAKVVLHSSDGSSTTIPTTGLDAEVIKNKLKDLFR